MTEQKSSRLSRYRDQYRLTKSEHRPLPVLVPFASIAVLVVIALLFLDPLAGNMHGHWPSWLANNAAHVTDVGRSWWILTLSTTILLGGWALQRIGAFQSAERTVVRATSMAFYILCSVGLSALIANILKRAIGRPRPVEYGEHGLFSFHPFTWNFDFESFPSGHSTVNGALFMALALLFPRLRWPLLALGFCFALTRIFVGAHFPSDVAAGFGFGMWFAFVTALVFSRFGLVFGTSGERLSRLT